MKNTLYIAVIVTIVTALFACEKKYDRTADIEKVDGTKAYLKVVHASPSFTRIHDQPDVFHVMINNKKITSAGLPFGSAWPFSVNSSTNSQTATYAAIPPGLNTVRLTLAGKDRPDSIYIYGLEKQFEPGKFYSLIVTDSMNSPLDSSKIFVEDPFKELTPLTGYINVRFVHAVMNDTTGKTINISSYARNANIVTNLKPGTTTSFSRITYNPGVVDTLYVRRYVSGGAGNTGFILAKLPLNSANMGGGTLDQRSFTIFYRGDGDLATGTKARALAAYIND